MCVCRSISSIIHLKVGFLQQILNSVTTCLELTFERQDDKELFLRTSLRGNMGCTFGNTLDTRLYHQNSCICCSNNDVSIETLGTNKKGMSEKSLQSERGSICDALLLLNSKSRDEHRFYFLSLRRKDCCTFVKHFKLSPVSI